MFVECINIIFRTDQTLYFIGRVKKNVVPPPEVSENPIFPESIFANSFAILSPNPREPTYFIALKDDAGLGKNVCYGKCAEISDCGSGRHCE